MIGKPDCTIFADASFNPNTLKAGWGAWIKADNKASFIAGGYIQEARESSHAEMVALENALRTALQRQLVRPGFTVMMQSDSMMALGAMMKFIAGTQQSPAKGGLPVTTRKKRFMAPEYVTTMEALKVMTSENALSLHVRHVYGHQPGHGRSWVNRVCDSVARAAANGKKNIKFEGVIYYLGQPE